MTSRKDDSGVSVIVGTLLLILITVTAAAGLAVMISQMQKDAMNRQTHITAVQNEQTPDYRSEFCIQPCLSGTSIGSLTATIVP